MPLPPDILEEIYRRVTIQPSGTTEVSIGKSSVRYAVMYRCDGCGELHPVPDLGFETIKDLWRSSDYKATCPDTDEVTVLQGAINIEMVAQHS